MASKRTIIKMQSTESSHFYTTTVNKKNQVGKKLEKKMYDPTLRKHVLYKEKKMK